MLRLNRSFSILVLAALLGRLRRPSRCADGDAGSAHRHADTRSTDGYTPARRCNTSTAVASSRRQG